ncbi:MAG: hypothetical protein B7X04_00110 [Parcubacteria group bacterium 21-54-25]|nr:MAG: hypothetical protein B7X04_00110 [Parcubacteria group bacterium 21-54-25]
MGKEDVLVFSEHFEKHLLSLHSDLVRGKYKHGPYTRFLIQDPKLRHIAKASVRDRVLHHAICRVIAPSFDRAFIFDAYSSRKTKGVHRAIERLQSLAQKLSRNNTQTVWALKCDVRKFFDSVGHVRLLELCARRIRDERVMALLKDILGSFETKQGKGIPLGNLTSQLFANIYLDPLDQYVKRELRVKNYLRSLYCYPAIAPSSGVFCHSYVIFFHRISVWICTLPKYFFENGIRVSTFLDMYTFRTTESCVRKRRNGCSAN